MPTIHDQVVTLQKLIEEAGGFPLDQSQSIPYQPFRQELYSCTELMKGYHPENDQSLDYRIYQHFASTRHHPPILEALFQRIHDHAMDEGLRKLLDFDGKGMSRKKGIGIMGGHATLRSDPFYRATAITARLLASNGYFIVSGGGPGIMEAANLGAYFASYSEEELVQAMDHLAQAPHYSSDSYLSRSFEIRNKFPHATENLAIPTWFYGHEPSNLFATHIAKYFSNSLREDNLLAISLYGVIFAPGSAGTTQEIFQDAAQNHYGTFGFQSPMVFLGQERYEIETLIYPLLKQLAWHKPYRDLLYISDSPREIVDFIQQHPPMIN